MNICWYARRPSCFCAVAAKGWEEGEQQAFVAYEEAQHIAAVHVWCKIVATKVCKEWKLEKLNRRQSVVEEWHYNASNQAVSSHSMGRSWQGVATQLLGKTALLNILTIL